MTPLAAVLKMGCRDSLTAFSECVKGVYIGIDYDRGLVLFVACMLCLYYLNGWRHATV